MGFSSRLKAHRHLLTLETLKFIVEYLAGGDVKGAAIRSGIPEAYASRQGSWLMKLPVVKKVLAGESGAEIDARDLRRLQASLMTIEEQIQICRGILNLDEDDL